MTTIAETFEVLIIIIVLLPPFALAVGFVLLLDRAKHSGPFQSYRPPTRMHGFGWGRRYPHNIKGMPRRRSGGASQPGPTY
jgi:hypothetical protein